MKKLISLLAGFALASCASGTAPVSNPIFTGTMTLPGNGTITGSAGAVQISGTGGTGGIVLSPSGSGQVTAVASTLVPNTPSTYDLGTSTALWNNIYLETAGYFGGSIYVGGTGFSTDLRIFQGTTPVNGNMTFNNQGGNGFFFTGMSGGPACFDGSLTCNGSTDDLGNGLAGGSWNHIYTNTGVLWSTGQEVIVSGGVMTILNPSSGGVQIGSTLGQLHFTASGLGTGPLSLNSSHNLTAGVYPIQATVYISSNQNIASAVETPVSWNSASANDSTIWASGSPTLMSVPSGAKRVQLFAQSRWNMSSNIPISIKIKDNLGDNWAVDTRLTVVMSAGGPPGATAHTPVIDLTTYATITSFVMDVEQDSGSTQALISNAGGLGQTTFTMVVDK